MIITFCGHGTLTVSEKLTLQIQNTILDNIKPGEPTTFYCGGYGDFDSLCAKVCRKLKSLLPDSEIVFVTPYITPSQQERLKYLLDTNLYDSTLYPPLENVIPRFAITKRNEWMMDQADLIIAYVNRSFGGAFKTLEYARKRKKRIINLAE